MRGYRKLLVISLTLSVITSVVALAEPWPLAIVIDNVLGTHRAARAAAGAVRRRPRPVPPAGVHRRASAS